MIQLTGHTSKESAFVIPDFPLMFGICGTVRYWVEYKKGYGQRCIHQTLDYNGRGDGWSQPKGSLYAPIVVMYMQDDPKARNFGFVEHYSAHVSTMSDEELFMFASNCYLDQQQKNTILDEILKRKLEPTVRWVGLPNKPIQPTRNTNQQTTVPAPIPVLQTSMPAPQMSMFWPATADTPEIPLQAPIQPSTPVTTQSNGVTDAQYEMAKLYFEEHTEDGTFENLRANPHLAEERSNMRSIISRYEGNEEVQPLSIDDLKQGG